MQINESMNQWIGPAFHHQIIQSVAFIARQKTDPVFSTPVASQLIGLLIKHWGFLQYLINYQSIFQW